MQRTWLLSGQRSHIQIVLIFAQTRDSCPHLEANMLIQTLNALKRR